ncbi:uncharacterized protein METZ01_LOCUS256513 [marine metagenome]|uniref:Uncharacterized protein n=1 Tax=marine metagenome TaxID=408172 RepID=A0A382IWE4_9ZZZZ
MQFTAIHLVIGFATLNVKFPITNFLPTQSNSSNGKEFLTTILVLNLVPSASSKKDFNSFSLASECKLIKPVFES